MENNQHAQELGAGQTDLLSPMAQFLDQHWQDPFGVLAHVELRGKAQAAETAEMMACNNSPIKIANSRNRALEVQLF